MQERAVEHERGSKHMGNRDRSNSANAAIMMSWTGSVNVHSDAVNFIRERSRFLCQALKAK